MQMRAQTMGDVVFNFITPILSLLHQNNIGVTYLGTSNFKMELVNSMPIYFVVMPQSIITILKFRLYQH
jgi:hypothetical protein